MAQHSMTRAPDAPASKETKSETYLRQIRNMIGWLMVVVALVVVGQIISGVIIGAHIASSNGPASSSCVSQGGTLPGC